MGCLHGMSDPQYRFEGDGFGYSVKPPVRYFMCAGCVKGTDKHCYGCPKNKKAKK